MEPRALRLLMICCFINVSNLRPLIHPSNGLGICRKNLSLTALEVLPGGGWDNLRNIDMGRVMNLSYSQCQTTEDGVYLIPDEVFVIPQKESGVETHSEIITSWLNQTSSTSSSINADVSFLSVLNGKYSEENRRMKTHQVKDNSVTSRVQVRNHLYTVKAYPDFTLDSRFAQQAVEIADAIENNQTRLATYLSEKLILDYGTHVITSVDGGATLVQEDYLKKSFVSSSQQDMSSVSASAGLNFFDKLKFDISSKDSQESAEIRGYQSNVAYSLMKSHGGALFYPGMTLQKWQESTLNNLVAIDRSGLPIHYFLNPSTFPDLPAPTVNKMASSVRQAAKKYYEKIPEYSGYLFGGLYGPSLQNPLTKSNSCPPNYFAIKFLSNGIMICLSNDYEGGTRFSVPFGGFFSCQTGNPLAKGQNRCPPQFSQHLAAISDGCQVMYCVQSGAFTGGQLKPVHLPPFTSPPLVGMTATNTVAVMTEGDHSWVRVGETKMWRLVKPDEINRMKMAPVSSQMSGGEKAGVAVGVIILVALVVAGTVFLIKKRGSSGLRVSRGYQEL
ncbi:hypothetical protein Q8A67_010099 [Cirrhinus molitorella]|uniref:Macrophage-expressed gene 1 protein n=1 Tax=Cirrhinus molitorella TaxID=172907 RepID=A0AA88TQ48_9TELE|nr:hypothetical protein Q8A67_010099 [Cirrhinus molitorella]